MRLQPTHVRTIGVASRYEVTQQRAVAWKKRNLRERRELNERVMRGFEQRVKVMSTHADAGGERSIRTPNVAVRAHCAFRVCSQERNRGATCRAWLV